LFIGCTMLGTMCPKESSMFCTLESKNYMASFELLAL
jgi:hypothetical protein